MEEHRIENPEVESVETPQEKPNYVPRPTWQVWAARIALVIFILGLILYYLNVFRGGV